MENETVGALSILTRAAYYVAGTILFSVLGFLVLSALGIFAILGSFAVSTWEPAGYFSLLAVAGTAVYTSQLVVSGDAKTVEEMDERPPFLTLVIIAGSYYTLLVVVATLAAAIGFHTGGPVIAVLAALLAGPADMELADKFNASPVSLLVVFAVAVGVAFDMIREGTSPLEPRRVTMVVWDEFRRTPFGGFRPS